MNKRFHLLFFLLGLILFTHSHAQIDTGAIKNDSINASLLKTFNDKVSLIEEQRIKDSLKKEELQQRINALSTSNSLEKQALQQQLSQLRSKDSLRLIEKKRQIDSLRNTAVGYPVRGFFDDTLFVIYNNVGGFSAAERAEAIQRRILKLGETLGFNRDSLLVRQSEYSWDVVYKETSILGVTENDALWSDSSQHPLAIYYRQVIADEVEKYKAETSIKTIAKEIGIAVLVILLVWIIIHFTFKFFRWTAKKIQEQKDTRIKGFKIKNYTLLDAQHQVNFIISVNNFFKWVVTIIIIYLAMPILFSIFPWTENFAELLLGYVLNPVKRIALGVWDYLPDLITIIVIVFVFRYVLKVVHFLAREIERGALHINGFYPDWANPSFQIIRLLIFAFMLVVIFPYLPGSDSPVFKGVSVFLGFLFTFGSAGSLSNVISGLVITYMRLFKKGDRVKVGDVTGDVVEKTLLVTRIRTIKNEVISIPNSTILTNHSINYSSDAPTRGLILHTTVTIGYDVPWKKMHQALIDAALRTSLILKDPQPFVLQTSLDDFYVSYQLNAYTREANKQAIIYSELHQHIQDVCNEQGIEIMSPHYRAGRDGNESTIPSFYRNPSEDSGADKT